jgi:MATE family multidrug resistance protein
MQGIHKVRPALVIVVLANGLNALANWVLIYGRWGMPALGSTGAAWATTISRWAMLAALAAWVFGHRDLRRFAVWAPRGAVDRALLGRLFRLGAPVGMQYGMEVGIFAATALLMGRFGPVPLAGHQIALNLCSITFMVPLGFSATAAVRVGHALGRGDAGAARRAAFTAYALGAGFMGFSALSFLLFPEALAGIYTDDESVVRMGARLLLIGGVFQLSDGCQTIGIGALRGAADTRIPMFVTIVAYWGVGLPLGWLLAFLLRVGPEGLWWGLTCGLTVVAVTLAARFHRRVRPERLELLQAV